MSLLGRESALARAASGEVRQVTQLMLDPARVRIWAGNARLKARLWSYPDIPDHCDCMCWPAICSAIIIGSTPRRRKASRRVKGVCAIVTPHLNVQFFTTKRYGFRNDIVKKLTSNALTRILWINRNQQ